MHIIYWHRIYSNIYQQIYVVYRYKQTTLFYQLTTLVTCSLYQQSNLQQDQQQQQYQQQFQNTARDLTLQQLNVNKLRSIPHRNLPPQIIVTKTVQQFSQQSNKQAIRTYYMTIILVLQQNYHSTIVKVYNIVQVYILPYLSQNSTRTQQSNTIFFRRFVGSNYDLKQQTIYTQQVRTIIISKRLEYVTYYTIILIVVTKSQSFRQFRFGLETALTWVS
eukprot:TRINITY_DN1573_c4_g1_i1.p2 TRINITY_DN1573_c4_g1~~TRINITY_DN1573_c4_g1_i1.p2  ORF type:complete len:219 (-),score=-15.96 TRINITY_DN1573_c4_g1_i1:378-1034(-)